MTEWVVLALGAPLERPLELTSVIPDRFAALGEREIAMLPARYGGLRATLGDFFTVRGERSARVRLKGDLSQAQGIGTGMAGGELIVEGSVGADLAVGLAGGIVDVHGNTGANAGGASAGAPRGMTGGELFIRGSTLAEVGTVMRRGVIVVLGDAGRNAGRGMIAGTVVVFGKTDSGAGRFLKRGSIVAFGSIARSPTFRYACTYRPPHLRVLLRYLRARHGVPVSEAQLAGSYHRYSGDFAELGKGEILQWAEGNPA